MTRTIAIGTAKGAFFVRFDARRDRFEIEGPAFKGWSVTAFCRDLEGGYVAATSSFVYGTALQRSRDLKTWRQVVNGPRYRPESKHELKAVWTLARAGDLLYAGVEEAGLFASRDGGEHWEEVPALTAQASRPSWFPGAGGLCLHTVLTDPEHPERLYCGISAVGLFRSDDFGGSFDAKNEGVTICIPDEKHADIGWCIHSMRLDPSQPNVLYRQDHKGMYRSEDAGDHWTRIERGLPSGFGFPLAVDANSGTLYAIPLESDEFRMPPDGRLRVYKSVDRGDSWHASGAGLPDTPFYAGVLRAALATDDRATGFVCFATTAGTVHFSRDAGESWSTLPATLPRALAVSVFADED